MAVEHTATASWNGDLMSGSGTFSLGSGSATDVALSWHPNGATRADSLRYDIILFESNNQNQRTLLSNSKDTVVTATGLLYNTTYYWQVTARNTGGGTARRERADRTTTAALAQMKVCRR